MELFPDLLKGKRHSRHINMEMWHLVLYFFMFLKINKATIGKLACNADIRFYMRGFNYCNNRGGSITALASAFDEWSSVKGVVKYHKTEDIFYSFCIPVIWNFFHRHVDLQLAECMSAIRAENLFLHHWAVCLCDDKGVKNMCGCKSAI